MSDDNNDRFDLSRRKVLGSIGAIGAAGAVGGLGTTALFSDDELVGSTFTAGELNLQLDWRVVMNGEQRAIQDTPIDADEGTIVANLDDLKQCDHICISFSLHVVNNPAWIWLGTSYDEAENGVNDPERDAGDSVTSGFSPQNDPNAELDNVLQGRAYYDESLDCEFSGDDCALDAAFRYLGPDGLLTDIADSGGLLLDGIRNETIDSREEAVKTPYNPDEGQGIHATPFFPTQEGAESEVERWWGGVPSSIDLGNQYGTQHVTFEIQMPCSDEGLENVVNQAQGDSLSIDFQWFAQQARHNGFPRSPWDNSLPDISVDAVPAVESHITGGFSASDADYHIV